MPDINIQAVLLIGVGVLIIAVSLIVIMRFIRKDQAENLVDRFLKEGNFKRALAISFKLANLNPNNYLPKFNIGLCYMGMKDTIQAIEYFEKASVAAENTAGLSVRIDILMKIAGMYKTIRKYNEALGFYVMVLDKDSYNVQALKDCSEILYDLKNYKRAKEYLETLIKLKEDSPNSRFLLANIEVQMNHQKDAVVHLEAILNSEKNEKEDLYTRSALMLADICFHLNNYNKSLKILRTLMDNRKNPEEVIEKIVTILLKTKQTAEAVDTANRYLNKVSKEKQCVLLYLIATAYFSEGEMFKAVKTWERAYQINHSYRDLKSLMSKYAFILQNPKVEPFFSRSEVDLETLIMSILKKPYVKQMIKKDNYWAIESRDRAYVFYRKPYPIQSIELTEIENLISKSFHVNSMFTLYSLYGVISDTKTKKHFYGAHNMDLVSESMFIDAVNNASK